MLLTPKVILATPRQLWAHLLCAECERRLNKFGETPVFLLLDNGSRFPLLGKMRLALTVKTEGDVVTFSGSAMGIDTDALAHFALGVLWKGSVHQWKTVEGQTSSVKLGAFREQIRTYLLGRSGFPSGVFVIVTACEDRGSRGMVFAPNLNKSAGSHGTMFSLLTRGIWFHIITDENAAPGIKDLCCVQSEKKVLHLQDCTKELIEAGRHVHKTARVSSNVSPRRSK